MVVAERLRVLDPVGDLKLFDIDPAPRLERLDGAVIGLYSNGKLNADELLDLVQAELADRHEIKEFVRGRYNAGRVYKRDQWQDIERCDAIILTHGD